MPVLLVRCGCSLVCCALTHPAPSAFLHSNASNFYSPRESSHLQRLTELDFGLQPYLYNWWAGLQFSPMFITRIPNYIIGLRVGTTSYTDCILYYCTLYYSCTILSDCIFLTGKYWCKDFQENHPYWSEWLSLPKLLVCFTQLYLRTFWKYSLYLSPRKMSICFRKYVFFLWKIK